MKFPAILALVALLVQTASAAYSMAKQNNVAVYWGQGPDQLQLIEYCKQPSIDIIILSFVHLFPQQANGYPGTNFGNMCGGRVYPGPGINGYKNPYQDHLYSDCALIQQQIPLCQQQYGKTILLSLGGGVTNYQLTGAVEGAAFANQIYSMFGPRNEEQVRNGMPRPFDSGDVGVSVDGFDFDIERPASDGAEGYKAMVTQLRSLMTSQPGKKMLLTGSPQCVVPDGNMKEMIAAARFDVLFVQFYNTDFCSAAAWVNNNPGYVVGSHSGINEGGFSLGAWSQWLTAGASAQAKIMLTLPGGPAAANPGFFIDPGATRKFFDAHVCNPRVAGIGIWEATTANGQRTNGQTFFQVAKSIATEASVNARTCPR